MSIASDERAYDRERKAKKREADREITIRKCADMSRRLERLDDPKKFLKGYFPNEFFRPFCGDQEEAIATIVDCARFSSDEIICAPRGDWKTETLKHMVIYLILAEIVRFPVWIGATAENAGASFEHIKYQFTSPLLAADFPEVCDPIIALDDSPQKAKRMTFNGEKLGMFRWEAKRLIFPSVAEVPGTGKPSPYGSVKMTYRGLDSHVRGLNILGDRPDLAPCDDLETEESARMDGQIETREKLLDNAIGGLGSGETIPRIVLGTVQNTKCLTLKKLNEWGGKRYQAVKVWPEDSDSVSVRDDYIELRREEKAAGSKTFDRSYQFYVDNQEVIERGLVIGNPHNFSRKTRRDGRPLEAGPFQRVLNSAADKTWNYVFTELQNDPEEEDVEDSVGITQKIIQTRISGLKPNQLPSGVGERKITVGIDIGNWVSHWVKVCWFGNAVGVVLDEGELVTKNMIKNPDQAFLTKSLIEALHGWRNDIMSENPPDFVFIDSGSGLHQEAVYEFVRQAGGNPFAASKGWDAGRFRMPHLNAQNQPQPGKRLFYQSWAHHQPADRIWLYNVHTEWWKHWVQQRFMTPTFDGDHVFHDGSLSLHVSDDRKRWQEFASQLCAEGRETIFVPEKGYRTSWKVYNKKNHKLDAIALAAAAAGCLGVRLIQKAPERLPAAKAPTQSKPPARFKQRQGGWLGPVRRR